MKKTKTDRVKSTLDVKESKESQEKTVADLTVEDPSFEQASAQLNKAIKKEKE